MTASLEVDDQVFAELQRRATPFVDSPNSVLRRVLGLDESLDSDGVTPAMPGKRPVTVKRAHVGDLLSEREYELPILRFLVKQGGEAPTAQVIKAVGEELADRLTETDHSLNSSGLVRWQNRVQFARLTLVKSGDMDSTSRRGVWRITQQGRARATGL